MKDVSTWIGIICFGIILYLVVDELGIFKERPQPASIELHERWNGSFTGRNGPCNYGGHNCPSRCNDWREMNGGGSTCAYCRHDLIEHDTSNPRY